MLPIVQIGPLAIQLPGLLILGGIWFGTRAVDKQASRLDLPVSRTENLVLLGLVAGVIGARLGYAVRYLSLYLRDPIGLLALQPATLSPQAGAFFGVMACWIYGRRAGLPLWPTLDALAPGFAVFSVFLGLSHLASGNAFGAPSSVPWAIRLWGASRHPSQVYEILAGILVLTATLGVGPEPLVPGLTFLLWVALTSSSRLFLEAFRGDSVLIVGGLRAAQVLALAILLLVLFAAHRIAVASADGGKPLQRKVGIS
jgi:phosphatidylglycerol:prolipoprotein diacylglycerol transferase